MTKKIVLLKVLSITSFASLPFLFALQGDFVFDDSVAVVKNSDVTSEHWIQPFYNDFWGTNMKNNMSHKSYRPLTILSFKVNYLISGKCLIAHHFKIVNLLCHIICCVLVWLSYKKTISCNGTSIWSDIPFLSTLLYAVHPVHVEAVSGIVGRADLLAANTFFLTLLIFDKALTARRWKYVYLFSAVIMSGISMLFKENGITSLGYCLIYSLLRNVKFHKHNKKISLDYESVKIIVLVLSALMSLLYGRWIIMGGTKPQFKPIDNPAAFSDHLMIKMMTYNYIYFLNFLLFIWPEWLCYDWSMGCVPLLGKSIDYRIIFTLILYAFGALILKTVIISKNSWLIKRSIILAVLLIIIPFLPASNIFYSVGFVIAERILYIPSAGFCLLIVIGFEKLSRRQGITSKVARSMFLLLLISFALRSWQRSLDWQNEYNLFMSGLSVCPLNAKVHYNVAKMADAKQQIDMAIDEYKESIRLYPDYYQAMNNLANLLKNRKQFDEAEFYLKHALTHKIDFPAAWMNLGIVFASTKRYKESEDTYRTALKYKKNYPDCYYNLGNLYLDMNNTDLAMENWLNVLNLEPKHVLAWTNLMALLDNTGKIDIALQFIPKVLSELPDSASINFVIANIYGKLDRYSEAEMYFKRAIELFDGKAQAIHYSNLGVLYHRWKKYKLAEEMYKNALNIDSKFVSALRNLNSLSKILEN